jgi:hypothetical protein
MTLDSARRTFACAALLGASVLAVAQNPQQLLVPLADYGDAPDGTNAGYPAPFAAVIGNFPTRYTTTNSRYALPGGHTLGVSDCRLGAVISAERGPRDRQDPDTIENFVDDDLDDGMVGGPCAVGSPGFPFPDPLSSTLKFSVTVASSAPNVSRYLNVLMDLNHDGVWSNEWVVVDQIVNVPPGTTQFVDAGPIPIPLSPAGFWMRVALTRTPIVGSFPDNGTGWDGSGSFSHGEIEDYLLAHGLAYAQAAASASADASDFAAAADYADDMAWPPSAVDIESVDVDVYIFALDFAYADAYAYAQDSAAASAAASASAFAAADAYAAAEAQAAAVAVACAVCPCAVACAWAGADVAAAVEAAVHAQASAEASASASASAYGFASSHASAIALASVELDLHVSAFASARAGALAYAAAYGEALALAESSSSAAAASASAALAAACAGDAQAAAAAAAAAAAHAQAAALALADADAYAFAAAAAWADARVELELMISITAQAEASASASAFAYAMATATATAAAEAEAAAESAAAAAGSAYAGAIAVCGGECCDYCQVAVGCGVMAYTGVNALSSVRTLSGVSSFTMAYYMEAGAGIVGFRWLDVDTSDPNDPNGAGWSGSADWGIWSGGAVVGGSATEFNSMVGAMWAPTQRTPLLDDCGDQVRLFGNKVWQYQVNLPSPLHLPSGDYYVGVRPIQYTGHTYIPYSHGSTSDPSQPSYFVSQYFGYPHAVPVSQVVGCDQQFTVEVLSAGNGPLAPPGSGNSGTDVPRKPCRRPAPGSGDVKPADPRLTPIP